MNQRPPLPNRERPGLIRVILEKPLGIVFEPISVAQHAPHASDSSSVLDVGAKIKILTGGGAAAKTNKLMIGDELVSIDDEFTSHLYFDDIMDIFVRSRRSLSLLFRAGPEKHRKTLTSRHKVTSEMKSSDSIGSSRSNAEERENYFNKKAVNVIKDAIAKSDRAKYVVYDHIETRQERLSERENTNGKADRGFVEIFFDALCSPCGMKSVEVPSKKISKNSIYERRRRAYMRRKEGKHNTLESFMQHNSFMKNHHNNLIISFLWKYNQH